jgi:DNA-binding IclR family transcriptional regulator
LELGRSFARGNSLLRSARPILEELSRSLGETAHIASLRGGEVIHLDAEVPGQLITTASRVGLRLPAQNTAIGKVLLAGLDAQAREEFVSGLVKDHRMAALTPNSITDPHKFVEHLSSVALQGFAVDMEECEAGLRCVATPVLNDGGKVVAAISVSGPAFRLSEDHLLGAVGPAVVDAAERLSRNLG